MATKRGKYFELRDRSSSSDVVRLSSFKRPHFRHEVDYIERIVLPTDTLQGLALLYNTTVTEIRRLNNLHSEVDLYAHRVLKVPSKGVLINLEPHLKQSAQSSTTTLPNKNKNDELHLNSGDENLGNNNLESRDYLNSKDEVLDEIKAKAVQVAASSIILNDTDINPLNSLQIGISPLQTPIPSVIKKNEEIPNVKWWQILLPCLAFVIIFPILIFVFQEHLHDLDHHHPPGSPGHHLHNTHF